MGHKELLKECLPIGSLFIKPSIFLPYTYITKDTRCCINSKINSSISNTTLYNMSQFFMALSDMTEVTFGYIETQLSLVSSRT